MKITDRDKLLILILLLACVIGLPIYFIIVPSKQQTQAYESELVTKNERYEYLKNLSEKQPWYESEIERLVNERSKMIQGFAGDMTQENIIMFLRNVELSIPVEMYSETFGDYTMDVITEPNGEEEGLTALSTSTTVAYSCDYDSLKSFLDYIFKYDEKMIISSIDMNYDSVSGKISGTFVVKQFAVQGADLSYKIYEIPQMPHGNETVFSEYKWIPEIEEETNAENVEVDNSETNE